MSCGSFWTVMTWSKVLYMCIGASGPGRSSAQRKSLPRTARAELQTSFLGLLVSYRPLAHAGLILPPKKAQKRATVLLATYHIIRTYHIDHCTTRAHVLDSQWTALEAHRMHF